MAEMKITIILSEIRLWMAKVDLGTRTGRAET